MRTSPIAWMMLLVLWASAAVHEARSAEVPFLSGRVVDNAEILSPEVRERLTRTLKAFEERTTTQVVVLTLPTLAGDSIEDFATRTFEQWKLGQRGKDNGVLIVVVPKDRRMRIEVGYGLEGTLPDVTASRIIRNVMTPRFKDNDFNGGIERGVDAVIARLEGRGDTADAGGNDGAKPSASTLHGLETPDVAWPMRILLGAFIFGVLGVFTFVATTTPGVGWFLYFFLIPFWAMFPVVVVGTRGALALLAVYVIGLPIAKLWISRQPWYVKAARDLKNTGHASVGGLVLSSGGGGGSSSSDGGGFSGGGGDSGGGGASGSW